MQVEDDNPVTLISQLHYSILFPHPLAPKGNEAKRRRRRKSKESSSKRIKLSDEQAKTLETSFQCERILNPERKYQLAVELGLEPRRIEIWFQNRRVSWRRNKLEEACAQLRIAIQTDAAHKCHLTTMVLSLKDELNEAKETIKLQEIERPTFSTPNNHVNNSSKIPSCSMNQTTTNNVMDTQRLFNDQYGITPGSFDDTDWINNYS